MDATACRPACISIAKCGFAACSTAKPAWSTCRSWPRLQNGTAFFASSSLIAVGGALALLRSTNDASRSLKMLPFDFSPRPHCGKSNRRAGPHFRLRLLQICLGVPAVQLCRHYARRDAARHSKRTRRKPRRTSRARRECSQTAGTSLQSRPARFFFALGYLGWFVSPWVLFVSTAAVVIVTWRRQFASNAWRAMGS